MDTEGRAEGRIGFRLRVGITGHRDPVDGKAVAHAVRAAFAELARRFAPTQTTEVRFELLSALAEGADRLFVVHARDAVGGALLELHAVLPLEVDDYRTDFDRQASKDEFDRLLAQAAQRTPVTGASTRDEAYERAGQYIVDHSDLMIAVWDGKPAGGQGGTSQIVHYARLHGVPLLVIPAARSSTPDEVAERSATTSVAQIDLARSQELYDRTVSLNRESISDPRLAGSLRDARARLRGASTASLQPDVDRVAAWALPCLVRADALAMRYQRLHYGLGQGLYLSAALAVTAVTAQALAGWSVRLASIEIGFMFVLLSIYLLMRRFDPHERWLGYRSLAEAFRSALFIALVKPPDPEPDDAAGAFGPEHEPWFQRIFSEAWIDRPVVAPAAAAGDDLRRFLVAAWIEDQRSYHHRTAARLRRDRIRINAVVTALFGLTVVVGFLHVFETFGKSSTNFLVFLAVTLPAFGAALTGIRDQHQYLVHEERSRRAARRLAMLERRAARDEEADVQQLAADAQAAIEAEKTDWWTVSEFQRVEMLL